MLLMVLGILWHVFPVTAMILMAPFGRKWEAFYFCLFFGPVGLLVVLGIRKRLLEERVSAGMTAM